jgi:hypothetical protein
MIEKIKELFLLKCIDFYVWWDAAMVEVREEMRKALENFRNA